MDISVKETSQFHSSIIFTVSYKDNEDDIKLFEQSIDQYFEPKKYKTLRIKQAKRIYEIYKNSSFSKTIPLENIELRLIRLQKYNNTIIIYGFENGLIANNESYNKLRIQQRDKSENVAAIASSIIDDSPYLPIIN